jgi:hypothetical protein
MGIFSCGSTRKPGLGCDPRVAFDKRFGVSGNVGVGGIVEYGDGDSYPTACAKPLISAR